jgi:hypothetical protein
MFCLVERKRQQTKNKAKGMNAIATNYRMADV